jgi:hypothetical protein
MSRMVALKRSGFSSYSATFGIHHVADSAQPRTECTPLASNLSLSRRPARYALGTACARGRSGSAGAVCSASATNIRKCASAPGAPSQKLTDDRDCHQPQRDRDLGAEARAIAEHQTCHTVRIETQQLQRDRATERASDYVQRTPLAEDVEGLDHPPCEHLQGGGFGRADRESETRQIQRRPTWRRWTVRLRLRRARQVEFPVVGWLPPGLVWPV